MLVTSARWPQSEDVFKRFPFRELTSSRRALEAADANRGRGSLDERSEETPRNAALWLTALGLAGPTI